MNNIAETFLVITPTLFGEHANFFWWTRDFFREPRNFCWTQQIQGEIRRTDADGSSVGILGSCEKNLLEKTQFTIR